MAPVADIRLCTVYWVSHHFSEVPLAQTEAAFQVPSPRGGFKPSPYRALNVAVEYFSACTGFDPDLYSCHLLRRGVCTFLAIQGASLEELMTQGSLDAVFQYLSSPLSDRILQDIRVAVVLATDPYWLGRVGSFQPSMFVIIVNE